MAQVNFNYRVDMPTIDPPTDPSGYIVAYDLDGILKQKDYNGVITPIGINPPYLFYNLNTSIFATNSTSAIYRQGSINIGSGTATNGRFVVSSSGGTVSLIVDELGNVYNSGGGNWIDNTAFGYNSLKSNIPNSSLFSFDGKYNSAFGASSLLSNTTGYYNSAFGYYSLFSTSVSVANSAFGYYSLYSNSTGSSNSAFGVYSLQSNIIGSNNSAFGLNSLGANTTGSNNSVIGYYSLASNTTGSSNVAIGYQAGSFPSDSILGATNSNNSIFIGYGTKPLSSNNTNQIVIGYEAIGNGSNTVTLGNDNIVSTHLKGVVYVGTGTATDGRFVVSSSGGTVSLIVDEYGSVYNKSKNNISSNLAFGLSASLSNTTGISNTAFGNGALRTNTNRSYNVAIGANSLFNSNADYNIGIGDSSLFTNTSGTQNTGIGAFALYFNNNGSFNTGIGVASLQNGTQSQRNTGIGGYSLYNTTGSRNIGIGFFGGSAITTGSNNVVIGSDPNNFFEGLTTGSNNILIGRVVTGLTVGDNNTIVGRVSGLAAGLTGSVIIANGSGNIRFYSDSSGNSAIGTTSPTASAIFQISSTTKGFLPPTMTNTQRTNISSPAIGLMVYCTDATEGLYIYKSTGWTFIA